MSHYLQQLIAKHKKEAPQGIFSVCSANEYVIEALFEFGKRHEQVVLLEATSNQVNQYGGYTGMVAADFVEFVTEIAEKVQFSLDKVILGGDHLGPNPWRNESAAKAMKKACVLIEEYVRAGFTKIHLDASMHLADDGDKNKALDPKIIAERSAILCKAAEKGYKDRLAVVPNAVAPVYVIGTEVPVPGGTQGDDEGLSVTKPADFRQTVSMTKAAFANEGLNEAWLRVVGVVVQPGVEFGDHSIDEYDRAQAASLTKELANYHELVFEGHSTDYQQPNLLRELVEDGVAILKVGPELTFVFREALFLLEHIERQTVALGDAKLSNLQNVLEEVMLAEPSNWAPYYNGSDQELEFARKYSLSDRIRYYWPNVEVNAALTRLITNLNDVDIPLTLLSQYLPKQYQKVRSGELEKKAEALVKDRITEVYEKYLSASQPKKP